MDNIKEVIDKINLHDYLNKIEKAANVEEFQSITDQFAVKLENILVLEDKYVIVVILDMFCNLFPNVTASLFKRKNSKILDAQLIIEKIKGINSSTIKENLTDAKAFDGVLAFSSGFVLEKKKTRYNIDYSKKIYDILNEYLRDKIDVDISQEKDTIDFYKNIDKISDLLFRGKSIDYYPPRHLFINCLFELENVDNETIQKVYNDVFNTNLLLRSYEYERIIMNNIELLCNVKGLYRKVSSKIFDLITSTEFDENDYAEVNELFEMICELNKDDEEGLRWFFGEIYNRLVNNPKMKKYLSNKDYLKKYSNIDVELTLNESLNKLLNGDGNISQSIIEKIGKYKGFIDKFEDLLDIYIKSKDIDYKRKLIIPLVVALIEKQKEKYHLNFTNVFSSTLISNNTLGYYSQNEKIMYINPMLFDNFKDMDNALVYAFETVFHETRHACQFKEIESSNAFSFDNLVMAIDLLLNMLSHNFYEDNYENISYEVDAREKAYVDCMSIFNKYPMMQERIKKVYNGNYSLSNYMRKTMVGTIVGGYYGIVEEFVKQANESFELMKEMNALDEIKEYVEIFKKYPVILEFFDIDEENFRINIKSEEYFNNKLNMIQKMDDSLEKSELLYSIKAFRYAIKVGEFLQSKNNYFNANNSANEYSDEVIMEVENGVGKGPVR